MQTPRLAKGLVVSIKGKGRCLLLLCMLAMMPLLALSKCGNDQGADRAGKGLPCLCPAIIEELDKNIKWELRSYGTETVGINHGEYFEYEANNKAINRNEFAGKVIDCLEKEIQRGETACYAKSSFDMNNMHSISFIYGDAVYIKSLVLTIYQNNNGRNVVRWQELSVARNK